MIYIISFASFSLGFSLAILLIARVSIRPKARKILKKANLLHEKRAIVPKAKRPSIEDYWID